MDTRTLPKTLLTEPDIDIAYHDALHWLFSFATYQHKTADAYQASKLNLERMRAILARLGNPHEKFAAIHIAGTKGKGSTAAMCDSILRASGIQTGLYTSPHLHTFRERIRVNGELISRRSVIDGIERLRTIPNEFPDALVFELITALAFDYLARAGVEFTVVEVGLGGRLDATNLITPRVSIITSISYDHMAILGNTLAQIAHEKAGIIKPNVPAVSAPQTKEASLVIEEMARERKAPLILVSPDLQFQFSGTKSQVRPSGSNLESQYFTLTNDNPEPETWSLRLLGHHQLANATTAIAAMRVLAARGAPVSDAAIRQGIENTRWPGRFEILERAPYVIVDGAHNQDSVRQLVATIDALLPKSTVQWIFGASDDKDVRGMFAELLPRAPEIVLTRASHPRATDPENLAMLAEEFGAHAVVAKNTAEALEIARAQMDRFDVTVITGSLFIVAEARGLILREHGEWVESDE